MRNIKTFNELSSQTYLNAYQGIDKLAKNLSNTIRKRKVYSKYVIEKRNEELVEYRKNVEKNKQHGLFEFEFERDSSSKIENSVVKKGYVNFNIKIDDNYLNDNIDDNGIYLNLDIGFIPEKEEDFLIIYDKLYHQERSIKGYFKIFRLSIELDLDFHDGDFVCSLDLYNKAKECLNVNSPTRADSNKLRRLMLSIFDESSNILNSDASNPLLDFLMEYSSEYGIEMSDIKDGILKYSKPNMFLDI